MDEQLNNSDLWFIDEVLASAANEFLAEAAVKADAGDTDGALYWKLRKEQATAIRQKIRRLQQAGLVHGATLRVM